LHYVGTLKLIPVRARLTIIFTGTSGGTFKGRTARTLHQCPRPRAVPFLARIESSQGIGDTLLKMLNKYTTFDNNKDNSVWTEIKLYLLVAVSFSTVAAAAIAILRVLSN
jgi:hypothetical protein